MVSVGAVLEVSLGELGDSAVGAKADVRLCNPNNSRDTISPTPSCKDPYGESDPYNCPKQCWRLARSKLRIRLEAPHQTYYRLDHWAYGHRELVPTI